MDLLDTLTEIERNLWQGGEDTYHARLDDHALMVLPDPAGTMDRQQTIASIASAPRWAQVELDEVRILRPSGDVAVLVYTATARREDSEEPYRARATSTYAIRDGTWMLVIHQQTPRTG